MLIRFLILAAFCMTGWLTPVSVSAGGIIYTFTDSKGVMHFTNVPADSRYKPMVLKGYSNTFVVRASGVSRKQPNAKEIQRRILEYENTILAAARAHSLDPALIKAVIAAESAGIMDAVSPKGAIGLMQLMPGTAADLLISNPRNPHYNIWGGAQYLKQMLNRFNGNITLALAAYNAGPATVEKAAGVPSIPETQEYIRRVMTLWNEYKNS
ncbi:MAG: transglycosylase SLT domain-containing protein [Dissulfuribacterales bacterium]